jgi:uncharacterized protein (TIGR02145 family)
MKRFISNSRSLLLLAMLSAVACEKKEHIPDQVVDAHTVTIGDRAYPTVKIGSQLWTATNYAGEGGLIVEASKNRPEYGKLYSQEEAIAIALPEGWRLPVPEDYRKLCASLGIVLPEKGSADSAVLIEKLMSASVWIHGPGTNHSGFNAFPAGYIYGDLAVGQGLSAKLMTSEKVGIVRTYFHITRYPTSTTVGLRSVSTPESAGLRFVKDEE